MRIRGRVHNGVVVLEDGPALPEGTNVTVSCNIAPVSRERPKKKRVEFPLVRSKNPGTLHLTGQRIAEILDEEDGASQCAARPNTSGRDGQSQSSKAGTSRMRSVS